MNKSEHKKTKWKTTDKRFVAFIDILGFKDKVMRNSHENIFKELSNISTAKMKLEETVNEINSGHFENSDIYIVTFSDSIVLFSKDSTFPSFEFFLIATRFMFGNTIKNKIAIKGGIAYGEISVNKTEQVYFGQPIIDAYSIEEDVNYMGVVCHNSIDYYINENIDYAKKSALIKRLLMETETPLKSGKITHKNLDWFYMLANNYELDEKDKLKGALVSEIKKFYISVSGSPRKYIDNTISLITEGIDNNKINLKSIRTK